MKLKKKVKHKSNAPRNEALKFLNFCFYFIICFVIYL